MSPNQFEASIDGNSIIGQPKEIKVEMGSRRPQFEVVGKSKYSDMSLDNKAPGISPAKLVQLAGSRLNQREMII
jgi:hypothetical protein